jgi:glutamate decarboxylase
MNLDGHPSLNLATFATTYMEEEAEKLMVESLAKNFIDLKAYPRTADIERKCVNMVAELYHAPMNTDEPPVGTSTLGSSEAIMLSTLAMKNRWMKRQSLAGKDCSRPNIIMSSAVQVCWQKAAKYFEVEIRYVYCTEGRYVLDPNTAISLVDENTVGICCIL